MGLGSITLDPWKLGPPGWNKGRRDSRGLCSDACAALDFNFLDLELKEGAIAGVVVAVARDVAVLVVVVVVAETRESIMVRVAAHAFPEAENTLCITLSR